MPTCVLLNHAFLSLVGALGGYYEACNPLQLVFLMPDAFTNKPVEECMDLKSVSMNFAESGAMGGRFSFLESPNILAGYCGVFHCLL